MSLYYDKLGKPLDVVWDELQQRFGYHLDIAYSIEFKGSSGQQAMDNLMNGLHNQPLSELDGVKVIRVEDYLKQKAYENGKEERIELPKSNVVKLYFENGNTIAVRPSGTEPKVKFYIGMKSDHKLDKTASDALYAKLKQVLNIDKSIKKLR